MDLIILQCKKSHEWINLINEIKNSGEGRIYTTNKPGYLAKIYHDPRANASKFRGKSIKNKEREI